MTSAWEPSGQREDTRHLQQNAAAGGVVRCAVVDVVARHVGDECRGDRSARCTSRLHFSGPDRNPAAWRRHYSRRKGRILAHHVRLELHRQRHGMEVARARVEHHLVEVKAGVVVISRATSH